MMLRRFVSSGVVVRASHTPAHLSTCAACAGRCAPRVPTASGLPDLSQPRRLFSTAAQEAATAATQGDINLLRNIGIIAHIDAGKTTTTERMLYFSNHKKKLGEIELGTTTTDFMDQERERGITIQSALTYVQWRGHHVNIIDTPGHADFCMEVERTLRVLDGAVAVFDGVKGVQAQSRMVLLQAEKYDIPFVTYVNKMDREKADFAMAIDSVEELLSVAVVPVQCPIFEQNRFIGIVDLIEMTSYRWAASGEITTTRFEDEEESVLQEQVALLRARMLDRLSGASDPIADAYLDCIDTDEQGLSISADLIKGELIAASLARRATAALCGSSGKNVGVQGLLDAVLSYLPSPLQRPPLVAQEPAGQVVSKDYSASESLAGLVFKVHIRGHDLASINRTTLVRLYSGTLKVGSRIYNSSRDAMETVKSISIVDGEDQSQQVSTLKPGWVACVTGLDRSYTGDTLCADKNSKFVLSGMQVPVPVVSCSLEAMSEKMDLILEKALPVIVKEDPSVMSEVDEFGQTVLMGMGALHLEVAKTKLERGWGLTLSSSPARVRHRECIVRERTVTHKFLTVPGKENSAACVMTLRVTPTPQLENAMVSNDIDVTMSLSENKEDEEGRWKLMTKWQNSIRRGVTQAMGAGPLVNEQVCGVTVDVVGFVPLTHANDDHIGNAADYTTKLLMEDAKRDTSLLEPCMRLEIVVYNSEAVRDLVDDLLSKKRATILRQTEPTSKDPKVLLEVIAPASTVQNFSAELASHTSGEAHFTSHFEGFRIADDPSVLDMVKRDKHIVDVTAEQDDDSY